MTQIRLDSLDTPANISLVIYLLLLEMCVTYDTPFTLEKLAMAEFGEHIQLTLHNLTSYNSNLSVILTNFLAQWKFPNKSS